MYLHKGDIIANSTVAEKVIADPPDSANILLSFISMVEYIINAKLARRCLMISRTWRFTKESILARSPLLVNIAPSDFHLLVIKRITSEGIFSTSKCHFFYIDVIYVSTSFFHKHYLFNLDFRPYDCAFCDRSFYRKYLKQQHEVKYHSGLSGHDKQMQGAAENNTEISEDTNLSSS